MNREELREKLKEILRLGIKPPSTGQGSWTICPEALANQILALLPEQPKMGGCKYAVISHGIGLSGEVEEMNVHCKMNSEYDYTKPKPLPPQSEEVEELKSTADYGYWRETDIANPILANKLNELIRKFNATQRVERGEK